MKRSDAYKMFVDEIASGDPSNIHCPSQPVFYSAWTKTVNDLQTTVVVHVSCFLSHLFFCILMIFRFRHQCTLSTCEECVSLWDRIKKCPRKSLSGLIEDLTSHRKYIRAVKLA